MQRITLDAGWALRRRNPARSLDADLRDGEGWIAAGAPGSVHEALLAAGQIPDPFYGMNENLVQWVGEADWVYRCRFTVAPGQLGAPAALAFDGLDTFATVSLNGAPLLTSDNMFVPARVPVDGLLRAGENELVILFESALRRGRELEAAHGRRALWNGDSSRLYVRKAQYHYGWDWGPCLLTAGPWRPVRLELGAARIADLACAPELADDYGAAELPVELAIDGAGDGLQVRLQLTGPAGEPLAGATLPAAAQARHSFHVARPQLWWPNGHGGQPLYTLRATLLGPDGAALDERAVRLGLRRVRLVQEPVAGEPGASFCFEVNGRPIFSGGANWIPADSFTTRLTAETYRELLILAAGANMSMLRIWGGGIYEDEIFYELCDELGLLVWQDFMFACGVYPAHEAFVASVRAEAEAQVRRLRNHPCLALWCGNNEDYEIAQSKQLYDHSSDPATDERFPARRIYERTLAEVCTRLDPQRPYRPGSPYGGADVTDQTVGDRHTWEVWKALPYQAYRRFEGRFVSEFGMQAAPALATLEAVLPPEERRPQSRALEHHNKAEQGPRRLAGYLNDTVGAGDDLASYCYATQLVQAEALSFAYRAWRRRWHGPGRYAVAGALVWQLNDCWPVVSWAVVDSALRPKAALAAIRRELAPLALGLMHEGDGAAVWAVNGTAEPVTATLELRRCDLAGAVEQLERREVTLPPLAATELGLLSATGEAVLAARLLRGDELLARAALWPEPLKYLALPDPGLTVTNLRDDRVELRVARPAKGVILDGGDSVAWADNYLDLLPDEPRTIAATGLGGREARARWAR
jgi:beta-mannosidase